MKTSELNKTMHTNATSITPEAMDNLLEGIIAEISPKYEGHLMKARYTPKYPITSLDDVKQSYIIEEKEHRGIIRKIFKLPSKPKYHRIISIEEKIVQYPKDKTREIRVYVEKNKDIGTIALNYLKPLSEEYNAKLNVKTF